MVDALATAGRTPALAPRTLLIVGAAGLVYGWLLWRRHLEAAMTAHGATQLGVAGWCVLAGWARDRSSPRPA